MALSLSQQLALDGITELFYDFLPWSGNSKWKGHINFQVVASEVGIPQFYHEGASKSPGIKKLLCLTLEARPELFERLITSIVAHGVASRRKKQDPITRDKIEELNGHLLSLGFKFRDLLDDKFLDALGPNAADVARSAGKQAGADAQPVQVVESMLSELSSSLSELHSASNRQAAGIKLQELLNQLFQLGGLKPRRPFRVVGEELDGSFELDHELYLLEAKWEREKLGSAPLYVFREKVLSKASYARGVMLAMNGVTNDAVEAITDGKQPAFFVMDGYDLMMILRRDIDLGEFLRQRRRLLAEEGRKAIYVPYGSLWRGSRDRE